MQLEDVLSNLIHIEKLEHKGAKFYQILVGK